MQVQQLKVAQGKHVDAGDTLCTLVDHGELYIEGMAFEQDIQADQPGGLRGPEGLGRVGIEVHRR